jgi:FlaA1/EpsC-like NDP-sugar epimerase
VLIWTIVGCKLLLLHSFGQFRSMLSYFSLADFSGIVAAMSAASGMMLGLWHFAEPAAAPPRGVILADFVFSIGLLARHSGCRCGWFGAGCSTGTSDGTVFERRIGILGAGDAGAALARDLLSRGGSGLACRLCFSTTTPGRSGGACTVCPCNGPIDSLAGVAREAHLNEVIIAMPSARRGRSRRLSTSAGTSG